MQPHGVNIPEATVAQSPIYLLTMDNLGEITGRYQYDGDQIALSDFANGLSGLSSADNGRLRAETLLSYDELHHLYKQQVFSVDRSTGVASSNSVNTYFWYFPEGNIIKILSPGGLVQKFQYNRLLQNIASFTTDGGGDAAPGAPGSWNDANSGNGLAGDIVLSQIQRTFDADGNVIFTIDQERFHDDPSTETGVLGSPGSGIPARVYSSADYFDAANRITDYVNFGTNGGSIVTSRPSLSSLPSGSLHDAYTYDSANNVATITDPRGIITENTWDMLHRLKQTIQGHTVSSTPVGSLDQTTDYTYDGDNQTLKMTAEVSGGTNQVTGYVYGVGSTIGTDLFSNDLIAKIEYPDPSTGSPSTSASNQRSFTYDLQGGQTSLTDPNGTTHSFTMDVLGRVTCDSISTLGTGVDGTVRSLVYAFDTNGQLYTASAYSSTGGTGTLLNQVQEAYNGLGQLTGEYQSHSGAVNTGTTPEVQYLYAGLSGSSSDGRPTGLIYPNGRQVNYNYNTGLDSNISRISAIADDAGSASGTLEAYSYLGLNTIVVRNRSSDNTELTYVPTTVAGGDGGDKYTGLDRFGRVDEQYWLNTSTSTVLDDLQYAYDPDSNVVSINNLVKSSESELFTPGNGRAVNSRYDALNRLLGYLRGTLSASGGTGTPLDTVSSPRQIQTWALDVTGNWTSFVNGSTQTRSFNAQNEITSISGTTTTPTFDNNGNMTEDEQGHKFVFNAWNQIVSVKDASTNSILESYSNDALGRRITDTIGSTTTDSFFNGGNVIEERQGSTVTNQYVWGVGYNNILVLRDDNSTSGSLGKTSSGLGRRIYVQWDATWNVTSLVNTSGAVMERFIYEPYGKVTVIDSTTNWNTTTDAYSWTYGFQGGRQDTVSNLVQFNAGGDGRDYSTTLGCWGQRDDAGYVNGANLFEAFLGAPISRVDPYGRDATDPSGSSSDSGSSQYDDGEGDGDAASPSDGPSTQPALDDPHLHTDPSTDLNNNDGQFYDNFVHRQRWGLTAMESGSAETRFSPLTCPTCNQKVQDEIAEFNRQALIHEQAWRGDFNEIEREEQPDPWKDELRRQLSDWERSQRERDALEPQIERLIRILEGSGSPQAKAWIDELRNKLNEMRKHDPATQPSTQPSDPPTQPSGSTPDSGGASWGG